MTTRAVTRLPVGSSAEMEEALRHGESHSVAYERHDATISVALNGVKADLLRNLASLYRLQAGGKDVPIPTVPLSLSNGTQRREGVSEEWS